MAPITNVPVQIAEMSSSSGLPTAYCGIADGDNESRGVGLRPHMLGEGDSPRCVGGGVGKGAGAGGGSRYD